MTFSFKSALRSALLGHLVGLGLLFPLSCVAMMLSYPLKTVDLIGILTFELGAAFIGFESRAKEALPLGALMGGILYGAVWFAVSVFGRGEFFTLGTRLLLWLIALALSVLPLFLFRKKKKRRRVKRR